MIYSTPGFLIPSVSSTLKEIKKEIHLVDGRGGEGLGQEPNPNHKTARKPVLLQIIQ
jgi:hypothetical protein